MNALPRLAALLLAAALAAPGCMTDSPDEYSLPAKDMPPPEDWVESPTFLCAEFDILWETAKVQASKGGYRIDDDATNYSKRRVVTVWKTELGMAKNTGKRRRRFVEFQEQADPAGSWKVRVSTVRQRNVDIDDPLNPLNAEWRPDDPDTEDAEKVAWLIHAQFKQFGPSKEFDIR